MMNLREQSWRSLGFELPETNRTPPQALIDAQTLCYEAMRGSYDLNTGAPVELLWDSLPEEYFTDERQVILAEKLPRIYISISRVWAAVSLIKQFGDIKYQTQKDYLTAPTRELTASSQYINYQASWELEREIVALVQIGRAKPFTAKELDQTMLLNDSEKAIQNHLHHLEKSPPEDWTGNELWCVKESMAHLLDADDRLVKKLATLTKEHLTNKQIKDVRSAIAHGKPLPITWGENQWQKTIEHLTSYRLMYFWQVLCRQSIISTTRIWYAEPGGRHIQFGI